MVKLKRTFRDKEDFINYAYKGTGKGGQTPAQINKFISEINKTKDPRRDGTIITNYKIALDHKIIKLRKRKIIKRRKK